MSATSSKPVVLLVEDNDSDIALMRRAFRKNGLEIELHEARDGEEALRRLLPDGRVGGFVPRLVILDLKMPKVDGLEVLRQLRAAPGGRRIPVVVLTSSVEERDLAACYDAGANAYMRKPVDFREFSDAIHHLGQFWLHLNQTPATSDA